MNVYILGRQPELGVAELESLYGSSHVRPVGDKFAVVDAPVDFERLGGSVKSAKILDTIPGSHPKCLQTHIRDFTETSRISTPPKVRLSWELAYMVLKCRRTKLAAKLYD